MAVVKAEEARKEIDRRNKSAGKNLIARFNLKVRWAILLGRDTVRMEVRRELVKDFCAYLSECCYWYSIGDCGDTYTFRITF